MLKALFLLSNCQPVRACVLGPPAVGKTTIVKQLCEHYKLHHIKIKDVIDESLERLVSYLSLEDIFMFLRF